MSEPSSTPPKPESWGAELRVLWDPRLRHLFVLASSGLVFVLEVYRFVSPFAFKELEHKRKELLQDATKQVAQTLTADKAERAGVDARQNFETSQLQVQVKAIWEEHVRYVAAVRKDDVDAVVKDYRHLAAKWPCGPGDCMPPDEAAESALSQPRRRR